MKHLDLFSGIGGFALAVESVWPHAEHTFVEIDSFCQEVLKKHWPNAKIHGDIKTFAYSAGIDDRRNARELSQENERKTEKRQEERATESRGADSERPFILTGGFPCQPFSQAGRRRGTEDDRHLWPEMLRVIREFSPEWVIGENVGGFVTWNGGLVLRQVFADLEGEGYEVQAFIIPAVAVGASHRRDRVWIVAHLKNSISQRSGGRLESGGQVLGSEGTEAENERPSWKENWLEVATRLCGVFNGLSSGLDKTMSDGIYSQYASTLNPISGQDLPCLWSLIQSEAFQWSAGRFDAVQNKDYLFTVLWQHAHRTDGQGDLPFESAEVQEAYVRNVWHTDEAGCPPQGWRYNEQYAEEHCDALSSMSHEVALVAKEVWQAYLRDRNSRLKALGNAIVPQVAAEIMKAISLTPNPK